MPYIDLGFITRDPALGGIPFRVHRRKETIDNHGRPQLDVDVIDAVGGVYPTGTNQLVRDPERDFSERGITIVTQFRLQLDSPGHKADLVEWPLRSGNLWLVNHLNDYSQYGAGFMEAQAIFFDPAQMAPPP